MQVRNDRELDVALGNSRKTKAWKNRTMRWSEMLDRMANTTRTPETMAEYKAMGREQQSEVKDVGGFVGGYCKEGRRTDIVHRSLLCLDADYADADLWPDWALHYGNAAAVYSTHKHTTEKPRLRLVVPLARDVDPEEYQAIGRRVAYTLGIDKFDETGYQPQRMMYWPSTSQDGEYFYGHLDGPLLDPDTVLATYHNWRDVSTWPVSTRAAEVVKRTAAKQKDPTTKGGLVGAFCRAYTIQEAIEAYVPDYQPCDEPGRYTYTKGSTGAGVVVYDDKYTYSHHATDPASGQLCNAWDLVRLHQYGDLDVDCDPGQAATSRPSYKAMAQLASADKRVKAQIIDDRIAEATADFDAAEPVQEDTGDWKGELEVTEKGTLAQTIDNGVMILTHDPILAGALAYNEMSQAIETTRPLPWRSQNDAKAWTDADDSSLRWYLESKYKLSGKDRIMDAVNIVAQKHRYHPVREYLDSCEWDGIPRVDTLLVDCLGAENTDYTRAVTRKTLVAAVARIYEPGRKFDQMLTLQGPQGIGKSALIGKLGGDWYSDTFTTMQGKEAYEQVQGVWLMEVGELDSMKKAEVSTVKLFISKQTDRFRPAFGRRTQEFPRQCVFFGTTNENQFLRDSTGNRRFWVVDTPNSIPRTLLQPLRDLDADTVRKIWAEALTMYKAGEDLYLPHDLEREAQRMQEYYEEENPKEGLVADYLERLLPEGWDDLDLYTRRQWLETDAQGTVPRECVCSLEVYAEALGGNPERIDRMALREVRDIMSRMDEWRNMGNKMRTIKPYGRQRYYERRQEDDRL